MNLFDGYDNFEVLIVTTTQSKDEWIMDSGYTYHMTPRREFLCDFRPINGGEVLMGNDYSCFVTSIGSVKFQLWDGFVKIIKNVRWLPKIRRNLLSLGMFDLNGCSYKSDGAKLKVIKGSMVVLKGTLQQGLYILEGKALVGVAATVKDSNQRRLWHKRLRHMSLKGLQELRKQGMLDHKLISSLDLYESCGLGKSHKLKFAKSTHTSSDIIEYAHSDLWGSSFIPLSLSGCQYFLTIIDDHSRRVWVYFLKHENEAFGKFKEWKIMVENQTRKRLKKLRTDNGLEFCSNEFNIYGAQNGISRHRTCADTP